MDIKEDKISDEVVILLHGLGGGFDSTKKAKDFFVKNGISVIRVKLPGTSLNEDAKTIDEVIVYARKYSNVFLIAKSLSGPAALLSKGADKTVLWDPSMDLKWLASKFIKKDDGYHLRNHIISKEMFDELNSVDVVSLIKDEVVILAGAGPYAHFKEKIDAIVINGADHKFAGYEDELYRITLEAIHRPHTTEASR